MSVIVDIAEAVKTELNAAADGTFGADFTAERGYVPQFELKELEDLKVIVVPRAREDAAEGRNVAREDVRIDIGVLKKLSGTEAEMIAAADTLTTVVEQIIEFFRHRRLTEYAAAAWIATANDPIYSPEHWREQRQFTSVVTLTYRVLESAR